MDVEIFTVGGGAYLVNALNAVAAWTGGGSYASLVRVTLVLAFAMAVAVVAFTLNWRAWYNWFVQSALVYLCLMVPTVDVVVTDRIDPDLAPRAVDGVPLGLGVMASFTSQIADTLTRGAETVFGLPGGMNYGENGFVYGSRLVAATGGLRISDPGFAANLSKHFEQCVFYDVLLGKYSMEALANAPDVWALIGDDPSPARSQRYLQADEDTGAVTSDIVTCETAHGLLDARWAPAIEELTTLFGVQLYPRLGPEAARAKLLADLPIAYDHLAGVAGDASALLRQTLVLNAMAPSMARFAGAGGGGGAVDAYAETRADIQTEKTYRSIAHNAMKWVPILGIVLTTLFYALFPILFPLFLLPGSGVAALKGYVTGFFYLAAWGPLFVILHMIMSLKASADIAASANGALTLASAAGIADSNADIGLLAGYLVASVPFLAAGMAKGAMAISSQATSYLAPSQNAAEEAGREAATGNIASGNLSLENSTVMTRQFAQGNVAPSYLGGIGSQGTRTADGSVASTYPGASVVDQSGALSNTEYRFGTSKGMQAALSAQSESYLDRASSLANRASESFSSGLSQFGMLQTQAAASQSRGSSTGLANRSAWTSAADQIDRLSEDLRRGSGLSAEDSRALATSAFVSGGMDTGLAKNLLGFSKGGVSIGTGGRREYNDGKRVVGANQIDRAVAIANQRSSSTSWSETRDAWENAVSSSEDSEVRSLATGMRASYDEARQVSREAAETFAEGDRYQEASRRLEQAGYTVDGQLTQQFVEFVSEQQRQHGALVPSGWNPVLGRARSDAEREEEAFWMQKFETERLESVVDAVVGELGKPGADGMVAPSVGAATDVRSGAMGAVSGLRSAGPEIDVEAQNRNVETRRDYVEAGRSYTQRRIADADAQREPVEDAVEGGAADIVELAVPDPELPEDIIDLLKSK